MDRWIESLLAGLPEPTLKQVVEAALERRPRLDPALRKALDEGIDLYIELKGFCPPHRASAKVLVNPVLKACLHPSYRSLAANVLFAWGTTTEPLCTCVREVLEEEGIPPLKGNEFRMPLPEWDAGQFQRLLSVVRARCPDADGPLAAIMLCGGAGRYADLSHPELSSRIMVVEGKPLTDESLWSRVLREAEALSPSAPEWHQLATFIADLAELDGRKKAEGVGLALLEDFRNAVTELQAVPAAVVDFFGVRDLVERCATVAPSQSVFVDATAKVRGLALVLAGGQPLTVPAVNRVEHRRQEEQLKAIDAEIASARASIEAVLAPAARTDRVVEPADPEDVPALAPIVAAREPEAIEAAVSPAPNPAPLAEAPAEVAEQRKAPSVPAGTVASTDVLEAPRPESRAPSGEPSVDPQSKRADSQVQPPEPVVPPQSLPANLGSFESFAAAYWLAAGGECEPVPWREPGYTNLLAPALESALRDWQLGIAWLFAVACHAVGGRGTVAASDIEALSAILSFPDSATAGSFPERVQQFRDGSGSETPEWRLRLVVEAARPSRGAPLGPKEIDSAAATVGFADANLKAVVVGCLKLAASGVEPIAVLREHLHALKPAEAASELERHRARLHQEYARLFSAAGGRIERTHCRQAWAEFMTAAKPVLQPLFPAKQKGAMRWDPVAARRQLGGLLQVHATIADRLGAHLVDRERMDKAAAELVDAATAVNEFAARLWTAGGRNELGDRLPTEAAKRLLASDPLVRPEEEAGRKLFEHLLARAVAPVQVPLVLTLADIAARPRLLAATGRLTVPVGESGDAPVIPVGRVADPVLASAILLAPPVAFHRDASPRRALVKSLASPALAWLLPLAGTLLKDEVVGAKFGPELELFEAHRKAEAAWRSLDELAGQSAPVVAAALRRAGAIVENPGDRDPNLVKAWLAALAAFAEQEVQALIESLRRQLPSDDGEAKKAVEERRYADARRLAGLAAATESDPVRARSYRATDWRALARSRYPNPFATLQEQFRKDKSKLLECWLKGLQGKQVGADQPLRTAFIETFLPGAQGSWNQRKEHQIPSEEPRRRLALQNPTFLPQLRHFSKIVVQTAAAAPTAGNFSIATAATLTTPDALHIVLAPRVSQELRDATVAEFRKRKQHAALFDDLDLCRLLGIGGQQPDPLLATLELALEQQPWTAHFTPFTTAEGQHVHLETYVGRQEEAAALARTGRYSRLFSGRKLGKSALLRYVHNTYNGKPLNSGNTLHVLLVAAVGAQSDAVVVQKIAEAFENELAFKVPDLQIGDAPAEALVRLSREFVLREPRKNVLVILDEADQFFEAQLDAYERDKEACLSFRMRSEVESHHDNSDFPRIRFLFAGYRATHRHEGAWANWGDVLTLKPLSIEEGASLVAGPLARLGINVGAQAAALAFRCGCQPAVLIRLGLALLKRLEKGQALRQREALSLEKELAAAVNDESVVQEIGHVVWNNFQDNPRAKAVFATLLDLYSEYPPGTSLREPVGLLEQRLELFDPDLSWLHPEPAARQLELTGLLRDFVSRELLVRDESPQGPAFRLRFPHHLPALVQGDLDQQVRQEIRAVRSRGSAQGLPAKGLVPKESFAFLRGLVNEPSPEYPIRAIVAGWSWPEALSHLSGGIPDRLGVPPDRVLRADRLEKNAGAQRLAVHDASLDTLREALAARKALVSPAVLLGGVDLLRAALGWKGGELLELVGPGRVTAPVLTWWFEHVRGLGFRDSSWVEQVMAFTSGVPWMVRWVEHEILGDAPGGMDIDPARVANVTSRRGSALAAWSKAVLEGLAPERLTPREVELVRMVAWIGEFLDYMPQDPTDDLSIGWKDYESRPTIQEFDPGSTEDDLARSVLLGSGVLPANPAGRTSLMPRRLLVPPKGDVVYDLARCLAPPE